MAYDINVDQILLRDRCLLFLEYSFNKVKMIAGKTYQDLIEKEIFCVYFNQSNLLLKESIIFFSG